MGVSIAFIWPHEIWLATVSVACKNQVPQIHQAYSTCSLFCCSCCWLPQDARAWQVHKHRNLLQRFCLCNTRAVVPTLTTWGKLTVSGVSNLCQAEVDQRDTVITEGHSCTNSAIAWLSFPAVIQSTQHCIISSPLSSYWLILSCTQTIFVSDLHPRQHRCVRALGSLAPRARQPLILSQEEAVGMLPPHPHSPLWVTYHGLLWNKWEAQDSTWLTRPPSSLSDPRFASGPDMQGSSKGELAEEPPFGLCYKFRAFWEVKHRDR